MDFITDYLTEIGIVISFLSFMISAFAFVLVYLNRNDKFRPQLFAHYSPSRKDQMKEGFIFLKNYGEVPAFISSAKIRSIYDIYTRSEQYAFLEIGETPSDAKLRQEYIHLEDSFKRYCENRTFLPSEQIAVEIRDIISTDNRKKFDDTNIFNLIKRHEERNLESYQQGISLLVKYKKAKFVLPFAIPKIDTFREKLIIFDGSKD